MAERRRTNVFKICSFLLLLITTSKVAKVSRTNVFSAEQKATKSEGSLDDNGYLITHFSGSGFNNQIHQLLNGAAVAKALNRTYCLPPFIRRKSDEINSRNKFTDFSEIFDGRNLAKIMRIENIKTCSTRCESTIDFVVSMSSKEILLQNYERQNAMKKMGFDTQGADLMSLNKFVILDQSSWVNWEDESSVVTRLGMRKEMCVELYQPFPAMKLIVDGQLSYFPSLLRFQSSIELTAKKIAFELFGGSEYISLHWRYEFQKKGESKCRKKNLPVKGSGDVCFVIFLKKIRSNLRDYINYGDCRDCEKYLQFVALDKLGEALNRFQVDVGRQSIYIASDADANILKKMKSYINFKTLRDSQLGQKILESESMEVISVLEQAICVQAERFVGTSYSTWTTTVWMLRSQMHEEINRIDGFLDFLVH